MTGSLPVRPVTSVCAHGADGATQRPRQGHGRRGQRRRCTPFRACPTGSSGCSPGAPITIDGNTLDTTLQLMLATSRVSGGEGLILSEDVATARRR